jgi:hypothetical protein
MSGFQSPNHTQTPNDFFTMLPDMQESEVRVTLVMIRQTFGWHREGFKMSIKELAAAAGLSRQGALNGAEAAEKRGTFKRTNPDEQGAAEWELVLDTPLQPVDTPLNTVEASPLTIRGQVRVKERIKKPLKDKGATPAPPEIKLYREVSKKYPNSANVEEVVKAVQSIAARLGRDVTADDLRPFYKEWTARGSNQFSIKWLTDWAVPGVIPSPFKKQAQPNRLMNAIGQFLQAQPQEEVINGVTD